MKIFVVLMSIQMPNKARRSNNKRLTTTIDPHSITLLWGIDHQVILGQVGRDHDRQLLAFCFFVCVFN